MSEELREALEREIANAPRSEALYMLALHQGLFPHLLTMTVGERLAMDLGERAARLLLAGELGKVRFRAAAIVVHRACATLQPVLERVMRDHVGRIVSE